MSVEMNPINYSELVTNHICDDWKECRKKLNISDEDLNVALRIFGEIAVEKYIKKKSLNVNPNVLEEKIKKFIQKKGYFFAKICHASFPFSSIDYSIIKKSLTHCFNTRDSIINYIMTFEEKWLTEKELENLFGNSFQAIHIHAVNKSCQEFYQNYVNDTDLRAGYYFLWMIKNISGCDYIIPETDAFNSQSVSETLHNHLLNNGKINKMENFLEILFYSKFNKDLLLYQKIFDTEARLLFLTLAIEQFKLIAIDKFPSKTNLLLHLLEKGIERKTIIDSLMANEDTTTSKIGSYFLNAFASKSFNEALPHFYNLSEFVSHSQIASLFNYPFSKLYYFFDDDPTFIKRLNFTNNNEIFIHNSLLIGTIFERSIGIPPYLLAFDLNTKKIIWGIPLMTKEEWGNHQLTKVGNHLYLTFRNSRKVQCIHLESGVIKFSFKLIKPKMPFWNDFVFNTNVIYQIINTPEELLICYSKEFPEKIYFCVNKPMGTIQLFFSHCGFFNSEELILFNPEGKKAIIKKCVSAAAYENMLYSIEKDDENRCYLNLRNLELTSEVISNVMATIPLNISSATIGNLCDNGELILFSNDNAMIPIFVNLRTEKVTYSDFKINRYLRKFIDQKTGEIWICDGFNEIWKISSSETTSMGTIQGSYNQAFIYSKYNNLYIC